MTTVLLVHGAWYGPWVWDDARGALEDAGFAVRTVELTTCEREPGTVGDLYDDIAVVSRAIDAVDGPVLVCAHSYGGVPVSEAISGARNVIGVLYVCAFVLPAGNTLLDVLHGEPPSWWVYADDGRTIQPDDAHAAFLADCPPDVAAAAAARLVPFSAAATTQLQRHAGYTEVPSGYLVCEGDVRLPAEVQRAMATPLDKTWSIDTGHSPFLARPEEFNTVLLDAVRTLSAR